MEAIDQAQFSFSPKIGLAVAVIVGFLVFAVALDLTWEQFRRVLKKPKAPGIGLVAQYIILPAVAFGIGLLLADTPSIALGWGLARVSGLQAPDRRAVTLEVAFQNVALAIGMAVAFFPSLAGVAITAILWGIVHLSLGFLLAVTFMRIPEPRVA